MKNLVIYLLMVFPFLVSGMDDFDVALNSANKKDFQKAITIFENLHKKNQKSIPVLVNLGNCYFETQYFGKAILCYEKALKIQPKDEEVIRNIDACYSAMGSSIIWSSPFSAVEVFLYRVGGMIWALLSFGMAIISAMCVFWLFVPSKRHIIKRNPYLLLSIVLLILFVIAAKKTHEYNFHEQFAIVTQKKAPLMLNELGELAGKDLKEGSRITILKEKGDFYIMKDENGNELFIRKIDVGTF
jgi:tetratricopeptide (TPR) repeat protein